MRESIPLSLIVGLVPVPLDEGRITRAGDDLQNLARCGSQGFIVRNVNGTQHAIDSVKNFGIGGKPGTTKNCVTHGAS
jgi:hypothetical protein